MKKTKEHQIDDKLQKQLAFESVNDMLKSVGIEANIVENLSIENVKLMPLTRGDYKGLTEDERIIHIEFQKGKPGPQINERIYEYNSGYHTQDKQHRLVDSYVFFTDIEEPETVEYQTGSLNTFRYHALTFKTIDGEEQLNNIRRKIKTNEELNGAEIITLKMSIYTRYTKPMHEIMLEACKLTNKLKNIPPEVKEDITTYQIITCQKAIDEKYHEEIREVIKMYDNFYKKEFEELERKHNEEIKKEFEELERKHNEEIKKETMEVKTKVVSNLVNVISVKEIPDLIGFTKEEVNEIIKENNLLTSK